MVASTAKRRPRLVNFKVAAKGRKIDWFIMDSIVDILAYSKNGTSNLARMGRMINQRLEKDLKARK